MENKYNYNTRRKIETYVKDCLSRNHTPTVREIGKEVGLRSTSSVAYHIRQLCLREVCNIVSESRGKRRIIELLGGKCVRCGFSDIRALQIDHVNGGGTKERKALGIKGVYKKALSEIESGDFSNYQILCANCNWIKVYENKEAPEIT